MKSICGKNINKSGFFELFRCLSLFLLLGTFFSCAGTLPAPPSEEPRKTAPGHRAFDASGDALNKAYGNFAMASLNMAHGRHEKARDYLSEAIKNDPSSIYLNRKMAYLLSVLKDFKGAVEYAKKSVELDPKNVNARNLLAKIYTDLGDEESAVKEYENLLEIDPNQQRARLLLATVLVRKGQFKPALKHLEILIQQKPNRVIAHYYLGRIHLELGNYGLSEKHYLDALKLNKNLEPALFDLGSLYQIQKKYEKAMEIFKRLLVYAPNNMMVRERLINIYHKLRLTEKVQKQIEEIKKRSKPGDPRRQTLGLIFLRHGRLDESIAELGLIVYAWPNDDKSRYYLASAYEEKDEPEKALEHFKKIKEGSEYYINSQIQIGYILESRKKYDEAITVLQNALKIKKDAIELYLMLASVFETIEAYDKAMEVIDTGLKQDEKNTALIFRLGVVLDKSGDKEKAIGQMRKILDINPDHADAMNYIGYTFAEQGVKLNEAIDLIKKALEIKPNSGYIIDSLGWALYQKGQYDEALTSLKKAFSIIPNDPTITEHLGDAYFKNKAYKKSLEMYKKVLSLKHIDEKKIKEKIREVEKFLE